MENKIVELYDRFCYSIPHKEGYSPYEYKVLSPTLTHCGYIPNSYLQNQILIQEGQITRNTEFGMLLFYLMASENGPTRWLEVGTWNGRGTTKCILEGLLQRENKTNVKFISYEANPMIYEVAKQNLSQYADLSSNFMLVNAKLPNTMPFPAPEFVSEKQTHFCLFFDDEKYIYEHAECHVPPFAPEVIILDGGEYVGYQDWEAIPKQNLKHIFLDDINIYKNKVVHQLLKNLSDWECVIEKPNDRNGWSYWRKRGVSL